MLVGTEPLSLAPGHIMGGQKLAEVGGIDDDLSSLRIIQAVEL